MSKIDDLFSEYQNFTYVVSHDLHAPLRQINAFTEILFSELSESGVELNEEQEKYKSIILGSVSKAERMLDMLLEFSRIGNKGITKDTHVTEDMINQALSYLPQAKNADIQIQNVPETIFCDKDLIIKALGYVLDNALKFHPENQTPKLIISGDVSAEHAVVSIKDNGIGMNPDHLDRAFTIMRKLSNDYEGDGLGLTFANKIATLHEGNISIDTSVGQGTTVHIRLPAK